jgi:hypothetical protein
MSFLTKPTSFLLASQPLMVIELRRILALNILNRRSKRSQRERLQKSDGGRLHHARIAKGVLG